MTDRGLPEVSVLVVNYRSTGLLVDCLEGLMASTVADALQVIVVDNASPEFEADPLRTRYPTMLFLPQGQNTTFTGGNNIASLHATGRYLLMLNPDTRVEPTAIERAVRRLDDDGGIVALSAYLLGESGELQRYYRRLPRTRDVPIALIPRILDWTPMARHYRMADASFDRPTIVQQPPGAFILIRREACPNPLLDEGYYNFFSDVELCRTLAGSGLVIVDPDVRCFHKRGGAGLVTYDPGQRSRLHQDLVWGLRRYFRKASSVRKIWIEAWIMAFWVMRLLQAMTRGRRNAVAAWSAARASVAGLPPDYGETENAAIL